MVGKGGLQEMLELLGGVRFNCEDAGQLYAKGHPYGVRVHVMLWSVEGRKENNMQRASFELLGGALF